MGKQTMKKIISEWIVIRGAKVVRDSLCTNIYSQFHKWIEAVVHMVLTTVWFVNMNAEINSKVIPDSVDSWPEIKRKREMIDTCDDYETPEYTFFILMLLVT